MRRPSATHPTARNRTPTSRNSLARSAGSDSRRATGTRTSATNSIPPIHTMAATTWRNRASNVSVNVRPAQVLGAFPYLKRKPMVAVTMWAV